MSIIEERLRGKGIKIVDLKDYKEFYIYDPETEEYFTDLEDMKEFYQDKKLAFPRYVYGTFFDPVQLSLNSILKDACWDHEEDIEEKLNGISELSKAIRKFNEDNESIGSYYVDESIIIKLY